MTGRINHYKCLWQCQIFHILTVGNAIPHLLLLHQILCHCIKVLDCIKHTHYQDDGKALGMPLSALSTLWQLPRYTHRPHTFSVHTYSHIHIAQVAVQIFNDMCMLAAVEYGQRPCVALVPYIGICWIDGDSSQVHHEVADKDGAHALAQQVKDSLHTLPNGSPTLACCGKRTALHLHATPSHRNS